MSVKNTIYLIGDAILDNYHTLSNTEQDLRKELIDIGFNVHNCATDHVKVSDVINGIIPNDAYIKSRSYTYPIESDGKMYPLKSVISLLGINKSFTPIYNSIGIQPFGANIQTNNMIVISMGGNDIHNNIRNIIFGSEYFINTVTTPEFVTNYKKVIETTKSICDRVVLISIYLPYLGNGSSYGLYSPFATAVINKWHDFIYGIAREHNIPILDLGRTLNIGERSHYGSDDSRVSNITNKCIAKCLSHIYSHYDGHHIYYAPNLDYPNIIVE